MNHYSSTIENTEIISNINFKDLLYVNSLRFWASSKSNALIMQLVYFPVWITQILNYSNIAQYKYIAMHVDLLIVIPIL